MKKMIIALLLVVLMVCTLVIPVSADMDVDARDSVVVVSSLVHTNGMGSKSYGWGTGFFINDQYLVTNHHVIEPFLYWGAGKDTPVTVNDVETMAYSEVRVFFDSTRSIEAFLVAYDEAKDLAILKLDVPTSERVPLKLLVPEEKNVGSSVYAVGYPGLAENWYARATETWGARNATVTAGTISRLYTQAGTGCQHVQTDCDIKPGNSGGPLVDSNGHVMGVATWRMPDSENADYVNYAVSISEVISLLHVYGIDYSLASSFSISDIILYVGIGIAALALVIIAILLIVKSVKKNQTVKAAAAAPVLNPVIRSFSRHNYGASAVVGPQPVLIGRNNVCVLRFPGNAPGISGSHCSVQWDSSTQSFIVTDLNSTYGTYLMSGQRMQPNYPYRMRAGDKFYLSEQGNIISLNME